MDKYERIQKICNEISSCTKCPHMKEAGWVDVIDDYGNHEKIQYSPELPECNKEKLKTYELMAIGINPGKPEIYKKHGDVGRYDKQ